MAKRYISTDQPGRVVACFIVAPVLAQKGLYYEDRFIVSFSVLLFAWDMYWLMKHPPKSK